MTEEQFENLQIGEIVVNKQGPAIYRFVGFSMSDPDIAHVELIHSLGTVYENKKVIYYQALELYSDDMIDREIAILQARIDNYNSVKKEVEDARSISYEFNEAE